MEVQRYTDTYRQDVASLHKLAMQDAGALIPGPWNDDLDSIESTYIKSQGDFIIGLEHDHLIAMGALKRIDSERCELKRIRVHPNFQGKGLGRNILEELEKRARSLGYRYIELDTLSHLTNTIRFFEMNGYKRYGSAEFEGNEQLLFRKDVQGAT